MPLQEKTESWHTLQTAGHRRPARMFMQTSSHPSVAPQGQRSNVSSTPNSQGLAQQLTHSRCSWSICWLNGMYSMGVTHPLCQRACLAHILASAIEAGVKNRKRTNTESSPDGASHLTRPATWQTLLSLATHVVRKQMTVPTVQRGKLRLGAEKSFMDKIMPNPVTEPPLKLWQTFNIQNIPELNIIMVKNWRS